MNRVARIKADFEILEFYKFLSEILENLEGSDLKFSNLKSLDFDHFPIFKLCISKI